MALAGSCSGPLCEKHLYIFRETPEKSPPGATALVITDPTLAAALVPEASARISQGLPWAPEQLEHQTDAYRLSLTQVDGRQVYQGLCLDTLTTEVCEVRPGGAPWIESAGLAPPLTRGTPFHREAGKSGTASLRLGFA
jgi:hypothetical protein